MSTFHKEICEFLSSEKCKKFEWIAVIRRAKFTQLYITARYLRQRRPFKPYRYGRYHKGGNRVVWRQAPEA